MSKIEVKNIPIVEISCSNCQACCCRLEVMIISDTGVPDEYIARDEWGSETMRRSEDGWCAALDRNTLMCGIYEQRPWICRAFEMGSYECITEREENM
jgi:uncharacterized protein